MFGIEGVLFRGVAEDIVVTGFSHTDYRYLRKHFIQVVLFY